MKIARYSKEYEKEMLMLIGEFFDFHSGLVNDEITCTTSEESLEIMVEWQQDKNELYIVLEDDMAVGFLRLNYRGPIVAWIEDIYIAHHYRNKGIGTAVILAAEDIVKSKQGYEALCIDVVLRNEKAISLYHQLGFIDVSLITLRKEFGRSKRDKKLDLFDKEFHY